MKRSKLIISMIFFFKKNSKKIWKNTLLNFFLRLIRFLFYKVDKINDKIELNHIFLIKKKLQNIAISDIIFQNYD